MSEPDLRNWLRQLHEKEPPMPPAPPFDGDGGGGDDGSMDARLQVLEGDVALIKSTMVTKSDLSDAINGQIKWMVGTALALGAAGITIMTFVLNNAVPKPAAAPAPAAAPIVIQVPYPVQPATGLNPSAAPTPPPHP